MWTRARLRYVTDEAAQAFGLFLEMCAHKDRIYSDDLSQRRSYGGIILQWTLSNETPLHVLFALTWLEHST